MISRDHRHASCWLIGESIREIYQGVGHQYRPKDIVADIRNKFGVGISYGKTWRAREFALSSIRGSLEESYSALPSYCYVLEHKNLDTITESIYLPGHQRDWMILDDISSRVVLPPKTRRLAGIPRNERILSGGESKHRWRCGRCGDYGHNRKSCK
ncbi:hypothetical protein CK203_080126 [Vitis vinifera]|uniref:CCHC-type domain-containing protein n=1 Tax=Vitis vinifera TaxID=29760 RepID=A0A438F2N0_VITVI|nr:hypothetical protein CK203_080126 [Vitis vinifera]